MVRALFHYKEYSQNGSSPTISMKINEDKFTAKLPMK